MFFIHKYRPIVGVFVTMLCVVDLKQSVVQSLLNLPAVRKAVLILYTLEMGEETHRTATLRATRLF
jgi:hypothetical protein